MFRLSDLIDLPIKQLKENPKSKHMVKSVLIDGGSNKAVALVCKEGTIKKYLKIIPYERLIAVDIDGVIVTDDSCIQKVQTKEMMHFFQLDEVINKTIFNENGVLQGVLTDIFINPLNGKITSFEFSEGYLDDFVSGRKVMSTDLNLKANKDSESLTIYHRLN